MKQLEYVLNRAETTQAQRKELQINMRVTTCVHARARTHRQPSEFHFCIQNTHLNVCTGHREPSLSIWKTSDPVYGRPWARLPGTGGLAPPSLRGSDCGDNGVQAHTERCLIKERQQ
jgi:hypothetical protein